MTEKDDEQDEEERKEEEEEDGRRGRAKISDASWKTLNAKAYENERYHAPSRATF